MYTLIDDYGGCNCNILNGDNGIVRTAILDEGNVDSD
jgi:hypothetical protein